MQSEEEVAREQVGWRQHTRQREEHLGRPKAGKKRSVELEGREQAWAGMMGEEAGAVGLGARTGLPVKAAWEAICLSASA